MEFFGYRLEKISEADEMELETAKEVLVKHGFRAVKATADKTKKQASAKKASEAKTAKTQEKIQNGLNLWRMEGNQDKQLTAYKLAQLAEVSQNTAKKYLANINAL